jgi:hypothetical protein
MPPALGDPTTILPTPEANGLGPIWARVEDFRSVGEGFLLIEQFSYGAHDHGAGGEVEANSLGALDPP